MPHSMVSSLPEKGSRLFSSGVRKVAASQYPLARASKYSMRIVTFEMSFSSSAAGEVDVRIMSPKS